MSFQKTAILFFSGIFFISSHARAEIVLTSGHCEVEASVECDVDMDMDMDSSSQAFATNSADFSEGHLRSRTNLGWVSDRASGYGELTVESSLTGQLRYGAGGLNPSSDFAFEFTVDTDSEVNFSGSLSDQYYSVGADTVVFLFGSEAPMLLAEVNGGNGGFESRNVGNVASTRIVKPAASKRATSSAIASKPAKSKPEYSAEDPELVDAPETADVGWKLGGFVFSNVQAVPKLSATILLLLGIALTSMTRWRLQF